MKAPPTPAPPPGTVTFAGGDTLTVPLETATEAYRDMAPPQPLCLPPLRPTPPPTDDPQACTVLTITRAELVEGHLLTGRGEATVPMWRFTVAGLDRPVERVAVEPSSITQVPREQTTGVGDGGSDDVTPGFTGVSSLESASGTTVTLRVFAGYCDDDVGPLVYEDTNVVVVGAVDTRWYGGCPAALALHRITVELAAPIGDRVVLDVVTGHPLAVRDVA